jgi:hypothetical protein
MLLSRSTKEAQMIELIFRKIRDKDRQIAFVKIDGQDFSVGNVPVSCDTDQKVLDHLNAREQEIRFVMLLKQYPEADFKAFKEKDMSDLEALRAWVDNGCKNKIQVGQDEEGKAILEDVIIQAQPIAYRIPKEITALAAIDSAKTIAELKAVVKAIIIGE